MVFTRPYLPSSDTMSQRMRPRDHFFRPDHALVVAHNAFNMPRHPVRVARFDVLDRCNPDAVKLSRSRRGRLTVGDRTTIFDSELAPESGGFGSFSMLGVFSSAEIEVAVGHNIANELSLVYVKRTVVAGESHSCALENMCRDFTARIRPGEAFSLEEDQVFDDSDINLVHGGDSRNAENLLSQVHALVKENNALVQETNQRLAVIEHHTVGTDVTNAGPEVVLKVENVDDVEEPTKKTGKDNQDQEAEQYQFIVVEDVEPTPPRTPKTSRAQSPRKKKMCPPQATSTPKHRQVKQERLDDISRVETDNKTPEGDGGIAGSSHQRVRVISENKSKKSKSSKSDKHTREKHEKLAKTRSAQQQIQVAPLTVAQRLQAAVDMAANEKVPAAEDSKTTDRTLTTGDGRVYSFSTAKTVTETPTQFPTPASIKLAFKAFQAFKLEHLTAANPSTADENRAKAKAAKAAQEEQQKKAAQSAEAADAAATAEKTAQAFAQEALQAAAIAKDAAESTAKAALAEAAAIEATKAAENKVIVVSSDEE